MLSAGVGGKDSVDAEVGVGLEDSLLYGTSPVAIGKLKDNRLLLRETDDRARACPIWGREGGGIENCSLFGETPM
jgi:hypothetical protein